MKNNLRLNKKHFSEMVGIKNVIWNMKHSNFYNTLINFWIFFNFNFFFHNFKLCYIYADLGVR